MGETGPGLGKQFFLLLLVLLLDLLFLHHEVVFHVVLLVETALGTPLARPAAIKNLLLVAQGEGVVCLALEDQLREEPWAQQHAVLGCCGLAELYQLGLTFATPFLP